MTAPISSTTRTGQRGQKRIVSIVTAALTLVAAPTIALACKCAPVTPAAALSQSTAAFSGRVTGIDTPAATSPTAYMDPLTVHVAVAEVWKGDVPATALVETAQETASCGYPFEVGRDYVIYATAAPNHTDPFATGMCSGTKPLADAGADLAALGSGKPPKAGGADSNPGGLSKVGLLLLTATVIGLIAAVWAGRRQSTLPNE
jgi:hypothetical protein